MNRRLRRASPLTILGLLGAVAGLGACSGQTTTSGSSGGGVAGVQSILFIKRQTTTDHRTACVTVDVAGGNGQVLDYQRYEPGGSLNILSPARADGHGDEPHGGLHHGRLQRRRRVVRRDAGRLLDEAGRATTTTTSTPCS